jgi:hypothetical protein
MNIYQNLVDYIAEVNSVLPEVEHYRIIPEIKEEEFSKYAAITITQPGKNEYFLRLRKDEKWEEDTAQFVPSVEKLLDDVCVAALLICFKRGFDETAKSLNGVVSRYGSLTLNGH